MERGQYTLATSESVEALVDDVVRIKEYERFILVFDRALGEAFVKLGYARLKPTWMRTLVIMATKEEWTRTQLVQHTPIGNGVSYMSLRLELLGLISVKTSERSAYKHLYTLTDKGRTLVAQLAVLLTQED